MLLLEIARLRQVLRSIHTVTRDLEEEYEGLDVALTAGIRRLKLILEDEPAIR